LPPLFKFENPIRLEKHTKVGRVRGSDLYIHWTVFVVAAFILLGVARHPALTILGLAAYWSVLLIHEIGHLIVAQRLGCTVFSIELYPIFGVTRFDTPWSRLDHCLIAWAGVAAQCVVAIPLAVWASVFGFTRIEAVNMLFAILGYFSLVIALFNLLPVRPLDGATAWEIFSALWAKRRATYSTRGR